MQQTIPPRGGSFSVHQTRFYSDCVGVFQGGGCRAAAFAGAYEAAFGLGVRFSEVAGTSAGSIVAALLAAGAEPGFLTSKLRVLDFNTMLVKPERSIFGRRSPWLSFLRPIPKGATFDSVVEVVVMGGLYSSEGIGKWVEDCLQELLGKRNKSVEFQDLPVPLHVVAGNLDAMKPRVWSSRTTPAYSVAHAVRASCTIPLFFQPVEEGTTLLVDGGVVSNLPLFVVTGSERQMNRHRKRVLLFMLEAETQRKRADHIIELLDQLVSLSIDGGTDVQLRFAPDVARIVISTGSVKATDFNHMTKDQVEMLIESGRNAADGFIKKELLSARSGATEEASVFDEHEGYLRITEQIYSTKTEVVVAMSDTRWFWELFPTVFYWRTTNVRVVCLVPPIQASSAESSKEKQRRELMAGLGDVIKELPSLPFRGFLIDKPVTSTSSALIFPSERSDYEPFARFYSGRTDGTALAAIHSLVGATIPKVQEQEATKPIERVEDDVLLERLRKNVQFYRNPAVSLQIEEVDLSKVLLISRYVRAFRYQQIGSLIRAFEGAGLELFEPARVNLLGGDFSIVTPPVVEQTYATFVALEGNTRLLYCLNNGIERVRTVVVRGVQAPLPGKPTPLRHVRITSRKHPPEERITGFDHSLFRDIERAVRPLD